MSMIKLITEGSWSLSSKSDPRWNCSGTCLVGGLVRPEAVDRAIERLKNKLKKEAPKDLEWNYMKN